MQKKDFKSRFLYPVFLVFLIAAVSAIGYFGSRHISNDFIHQVMAAVFGTTYFISVAFGTLYVFTAAYVGGASLSERILASFVTPFAWMTKEVIRITESHPLIESLYWYLNPLSIWLISLMIFEMGIATLIGRSILKKRGMEVKGSVLAPILTIFLSLTFIISAYAWGKGENLYVIFLEGYRAIFGSGL